MNSIDLYNVNNIDAALQTLKKLACGKDKPIVFCEDRLTLEAERALVFGGGVFGGGVYTFARYIRSVSGGKTLSKQGSVMQVSKILSENQSKLRCFGKGVSAKSSAQYIYETIAQLKAAGVDAELLISADLSGSGLLGEKVKDIALVYSEYERFLEKGYLDENSYFKLLPKALVEDKRLKESTVIFLGFSAFTKQTARALECAMRHAKKVIGIFCSGENAYTNSAKKVFLNVAGQCGYDCNEYSYRPSPCDTAAYLCDNLFNPESLAKPPRESNALTLYEAIDEADEIEFCAAAITEGVLKGGRFKDYCVLVNDLEGYSLTLEKVFSEYEISYYIDKKRPLAEHPLARFLTAVIDAVAVNLPVQYVTDAVASLYFGEDGDLYENYLLEKANYRGGVRREIDGDLLATDEDKYNKLCAARLRALSYFELIPKKASAFGFCEAARKLLEACSADKITLSLKEKLLAEGENSEADFIGRVDDVLPRLLEEAENVLGGEILTVEEFRKIIASGLASATVSLIPQRTDAVFVASLTDCKIAAYDKIFALSLTQDAPHVMQDVGYFSDRDMETLESLKVKLEPKVSEVNDRFLENCALSLCSFKKHLYLSYPLYYKDASCKRSEIIKYCQRLFTQNGKSLRLRRRGELFAARNVSGGINKSFFALCAKPLPAVRRYLEGKRKFEDGVIEDASPYSELEVALARVGVQPQRALGEIKSLDCANELFFERGYVSPTLLERFFECPYKSYVERGLRLNERQERSVADTQTGSFVHAVLEKLALRMKEGEITREQCVSVTRELCAEVASVPPYSVLQNTEGGRYTVKALTNETERIALAMHAQLVNSAFKVAAAEREIGRQDDITLDGVCLYGKIDRVDEAGDYVRVIDYKTGGYEVSPSSYYVGKKLQLELYLKAVSRQKTPVAAFYFPAAAKFTDEGATQFTLEGFMRFDAQTLALHDKNIDEGGNGYISAKPNSRSGEKLMSEADFSCFIDYSLLIASSGVRELKSGFIKPTPYESACDYCKFGGLCAFEDGGDCSFRKQRKSSADIAQTARNATGEAQNEKDGGNGDER